MISWVFPGGPVVKAPSFRCRVCGFNPWSGKFRILGGVAKKKEKKRKVISCTSRSSVNLS